MKTMATLHEWQADGKKYRAVYDETHETRGSYAYDTPEETKAAEDAEIEKIESGEWIAIGIIVSELAKRPHCLSCTCQDVIQETWGETDSLWGIVVDNDPKAIEAFARESM